MGIRIIEMSDDALELWNRVEYSRQKKIVNSIKLQALNVEDWTLHNRLEEPLILTLFCCIVMQVLCNLRNPTETH